MPLLLEALAHEATDLLVVFDEHHVHRLLSSPGRQSRSTLPRGTQPRLSVAVSDVNEVIVAGSDEDHRAGREGSSAAAFAYGATSSGASVPVTMAGR